MGPREPIRAVRLLRKTDVPSICELCAGAGWNQTPEDWERMMDLEPLGCFGIEQDGRIVATTTLLTYGQELAWVGMVLTHVDYQRRGYARQLVIAALELACSRKIRCVKLDATDQGRPLYASLGFEDEQPIQRWFGHPEVDARTEAAAVGQSALLQLDRAAFGTDRSRFLDTLGRPVITEGAFAMHRPGARASHLGPCTASSAESAAKVIRAFWRPHPETPWLWDILPANASARDLGGTIGI